MRTVGVMLRITPAGHPLPDAGFGARRQPASHEDRDFLSPTVCLVFTAFLLF